MQHCPYCQVNIAGDKRQCPLCGGQLAGTPDPNSEVFPVALKPRFSTGFVLKLLSLIAIVVSAVSILINYGLKSDIWWSAFVVLGAASVWVAAAVGIAYRRDITQNIAWQVLLISGLSIFWDHWTGYRGWSVDFVFPSVCAVGLLSMLLLAVLLKLPIRAFASSFIFCAIAGIIPFVLVLFGKVQIILPSLICTGISVVLLAAFLIFRFQTIKNELQRRFHI